MAVIPEHNPKMPKMTLPRARAIAKMTPKWRKADEIIAARNSGAIILTHEENAKELEMSLELIDATPDIEMQLDMLDRAFKRYRESEAGMVATLLLQAVTYKNVHAADKVHGATVRAATNVKEALKEVCRVMFAINARSLDADKKSKAKSRRKSK